MFKNKKKLLLIVLSCLLISLLILPLTGQAQISGTGMANIKTHLAGVAKGVPNTQADLGLYIAMIVSMIIGIVGVVFFILFLYGGFIWMTAAGKDENIKQAKKIMVNALIGLAIAISAFILTYFISQALESGIENTGGGAVTQPQT